MGLVGKVYQRDYEFVIAGAKKKSSGGLTTGLCVDTTGYDAFNALLDWLNTLFTLLPRVGRIAIAAKAKNTNSNAYSTRSCPSSSFTNLFIFSSMLFFLLNSFLQPEMC